MNDLEEIIPMVLGFVFLMIPIVAILTSHQRKMAQILHQPPAQDPEKQMLFAEIARLREAVNQQAIALDSLQRTTERLANSIDRQEDLADRLKA